MARTNKSVVQKALTPLFANWKNTLVGLITGFLAANYGAGAGKYVSSFMAYFSKYFGG